MEAAGNIRGRNSWHHSGVITRLPVAKAFAHVAIDVEHLVGRLDGVHVAFTPKFFGNATKLIGGETTLRATSRSG
jgi:hypothetical protein